MIMGLDIPTCHPPSTSGTPANEFIAPVGSFSLISAPRGAGGRLGGRLGRLCAREKFLPGFFGTFFGPGGSGHGGPTLGAQQNGSTGPLIISRAHKTALLGTIFGATMALLGPKW